jgi:flagellar biosynthesis protein FlhF
LQKVKQDLGGDAIILFTKKKRKGGLFGWLGTPMIEVTAGVDGSVTSQSPQVETAFPLKKSVRQAVLEEDDRPVPASGRVYARTGERRQEVFQSELSEGKVLAGALSARTTSQSLSKPSLHPDASRLEKNLVRQGVEEELAKSLVQKVDREFSDKGRQRGGGILDLCLKNISNLIKVSGPVEVSSGRTRVVAFIGPTGVGKTTNLVKLASQYALYHRLKVGIITADTYRIGAVEQLKIYRDIIDIPLESANTPEELSGALRRQSDRDLIFFDTAGRSPQNKRQIQDLRSFLDVAKPAETHLVVSATTKNSDLLPIVAKFGLVPVNRFLFTKLDETRSYGTLLNLCANFSIPVSYLATGQNVPNDIELAVSDKIASLVLGEGNGRSS